MPSTDDPMPRYRPYDRLISDIQVDLSSRNRHELTLWGGRKMGKTTVAAVLARTLNRGELAPVEIVQGRPPKVGATRLQTSDVRDAKTLVIDDADYVMMDPDGLEALRSILESRDCQDNNRSRIILTTRNLARLLDAANDDDICSQLVARSTPKQLEPWLDDWQRALREALQGVVTDGHEAWFDAIVGETGGHPGLVEQALVIVEDAAKFFKLDAGEKAFARAGEYLSERLSCYVGHQVKRALRGYEVDYPRDLDLLMAAATQPSSAEVPSSAEDAGLAYQTQHFERKFASAAIRKELARILTDRFEAARGSARTDRLVFRPDPNDPEQRGVALRLHGRTTAAEVHLSGSLWQLASVLKDADGAVVSTERLEQEASSQSRAALNSSLQRLRVALDTIGFDLALENVRGRGYRLRQGTSADTAGNWLPNPPTRRNDE